MLSKINFTLVFILFFVNISLAQHLKLDLKKGNIYYQTTKATSTIQQDINGEKIEIEMTLAGRVSFKVLKEKSNSYDLEVTYKSLSMSMKSPYSNVNFNSEKPDTSDPLSSFLSQMIDFKFQIEMNRNGTIHEIRMDGFFEKILASFPDMADVQKDQLLKQIKQSYGEKAFKGSFEMTMAIFPDKKVNIGDQWNNTIKLEAGMGGKMNNTFTLKESTKNYISIDVNSTTVMDDKDAYVPIGGNLAKYNLKGTMTGIIKINPNSGWIISSDLTQKFKGDIEIKEKDGENIAQKIPMSFENVLKISGN